MYGGCFSGNTTKKIIVNMKKIDMRLYMKTESVTTDSVNLWVCLVLVRCLLCNT